MRKTELKEKITGLGYTIEALEDELEYHQEVIAEKEARIVELIRENDRLTLTYEPYRPDDDEDHGLSFYGLKESNDLLMQQAETLREMLRAQDHEHYGLKTETPKTRHYGGLAFDFWPLSDWIRLSLRRWNPGRACQLCVGPVRFDFAEE